MGVAKGHGAGFSQDTPPVVPVCLCPLSIRSIHGMFCLWGCLKSIFFTAQRKKAVEFLEISPGDEEKQLTQPWTWMTFKERVIIFFTQRKKTLSGWPLDPLRWTPEKHQESLQAAPRNRCGNTPDAFDSGPGCHVGSLAASVSSQTLIHHSTLRRRPYLCRRSRFQSWFFGRSRQCL